MKIIVYSHYFQPEIGAPSARIGDFADEWTAAGHEVHVVTCFPNHPNGTVYPGYKLGWYQSEIMRGIRVHRNWSYVTANRGFLKKSLGHASFLPSARVFSTPHLPIPDCTVGSSPTFFAAMAARTFAHRNGVPFIMEVRDLWPAIFVDLGVIRNPKLIKLLERWEMNLYQAATGIVTVTESFRSNLLERGVVPGKVTTITNGADTDYWFPASESGSRLRQELGLQEAFVVLYIGAHGISQGLGALLKVADRVRGMQAIRFLMVGEGADKRHLVAEAGRLKLNNVQFIDPVDKMRVREYYSMANICVVPLRNVPLFDSFIPSKMFEIMSVGRPIVASVRGEAAEILQRSGAAIVVPPEDDGAIANAIRELLHAPRRCEVMGASGRAFVVAHYSRRELARRYLGVIAAARNEMGLEFAI